MKILTTFFTVISVSFISFTTNLKAQDTLNCRIQNINNETLTLEMLELELIDHVVVGVWPWDVNDMAFPPGIKHFSVKGQLHSEWPCFTFCFFDSANNQSAYSDTVCIDNSFKLLPPMYPAVEKRKK